MTHRLPPITHRLLTPTQRDFLGAMRSHGETVFRVWAPQAQRVAVVVESPAPATILLERERDGYFSGGASAVPVGALYKYSVDDRGPWPDPCSRYQPQGVHGPSMVVDPNAYQWNDAQWRGANIKGQVIYELHVGAFTPEGTFDAAAQKLPYLRDLGVTMLEIMPVAECPGRWNWGYDGVQLYAPYHVYGDHEAFKRLVDRAHEHGLAVILDVVYNHLGPDGNYLKCFSPHYFSTRHQTDWGEALNFDDEDCAGTRDFVIGNARYWLREFHLDGLRLDATQSIFDDSRAPHPRGAGAAARAAAQPREHRRDRRERTAARRASAAARARRPRTRRDVERRLPSRRQGRAHRHARRLLPRLHRPRAGIRLLHPSRLSLSGSVVPLAEAAARLAVARHCRPPPACIFLQNHDQVGNTFIGDRVHAHDRARAAIAH